MRLFRKGKGVSQEALGITFQQIQKYERGANRISAFMLVKAALHLGVSPNSLLPDKRDPAPASPNIQAMIASLRGVEELVQAYTRIPSPRLPPRRPAPGPQPRRPLRLPGRRA